jgi:DNA-binding response OmpR family regulator
VSDLVGPPPLVLVADDDPDMLRVIRSVLEDEGLAVTTAGDGGRAVAIAAQQTPDLAVVNVALPVLDGRQVAVRLRTLLGATFPLLAITGDGHASEKGLQLGAYVCLRKPFDLSVLVAEVWRGLGQLRTS